MGRWRGGLCSMLPLLDSACSWGAGAGDPLPLAAPSSLCCGLSPAAGPTTPYPFFQFSHAAEAQAPQDSKEKVRGCLPI